MPLRSLAVAGRVNSEEIVRSAASRGSGEAGLPGRTEPSAEID
jgi:hypothetical protein